MPPASDLNDKGREDRSWTALAVLMAQFVRMPALRGEARLSRARLSEAGIFAKRSDHANVVRCGASDI